MRHDALRRLLAATGVAAWLLAGAAGARAEEDPQTYYKQNCYGCHTIGGGDLQGPDLMGVEARAKEKGKDRAWLVRWIQDPGAVLDSGDTYALEMFTRYKNVRMPNVAGMSAQRAEQMLRLIEDEGKRIEAGEKGRFMGLQIPLRPFTPDDVDRGRALFLGQERLAAGGAACVSCHHVGGLGLLGGGRLGPDLTKVFERYQDRKTLMTWMSAPATVTMLPTFREHPLDLDSEVLPLVAYFEHAALHEQEEESRSNVVFLLLGFGGAAALLMLLGRIWSWRFRGVRKSLVKSASWRERAAAKAPVEGPTEGAVS